MRERLAYLVAYIYPRSWRERYGEEFPAFLIAEGISTRSLLDVAWAALRERFLPSQMLADGQTLPSFGLIVKKPSALIPIAMSLAALAVVLLHIAIVGIARQIDEGAAAHCWQLLMAAQVPILLFFAIKWLPKAPRQAVYVLALQAAAMAASMTPVFLLRW